MKIKKVLGIVMSMLMIFSCVVPMTGVLAVGNEENEFVFVPGVQDDGVVAPISQEPTPNKGTLAASYDSRDVINFPAIRSQSPYGTCWAHSVVACAEVSAIRQGLDTSDINLSELQMVNYVYGKYNDPLGNMGDDVCEPDGEDDLNLGGSAIITALALDRWSGLTDEAVMDYTADALYVNAEGFYPDEFGSDFNRYILDNFSMINMSSVDDVKQAIIDNGIVQGSYYAYTSSSSSYTDYYNSTTGAYYQNAQTSTNHAITILGWDDNYSKDNFGNVKPATDGAWLCRNSWGTWFGNSGYFWLSYADTSIDDTVYVFNVNSADKYDNNYQYDGCLWYSYITSSNGVYNTFTAQKNEYLDAVNISLLGAADYDITVKVFVNPEGTASQFLSTTPATTKNYHAKYAGIYTIDLDTPVYLEEGDEFVVYYIINSCSGTAYYTFSRNFDFSWIAGTEDVTGAKSYFGNGYSLVDNYSGVFKIKAFTTDANDVDEPENVKATLTDNNLTLTWDAVDDATAYEVWTGRDISDYTLADTVSTNSYAATVSDKDGLLLKYKVKAVTADGTSDFSKTAAARYKKDSKITSITLDDQTITSAAPVKVSATLKATTNELVIYKEIVEDELIVDKMVYYTSSNPEVGEITPDGTFTAKSVGTTTITAMTRSETLTTTATFTVTSAECPHDWSDWETITPATCIAYGTKTRTCSICNDVQTVDTDAYDYSNHVGPTATRGAQAPTCTTNGKEADTYCTACNQTITEGAVISAGADYHNWSDWTITTEATCIAEGEETRTCSTCSSVDSRAIAINSNNHVNTVVRDQASATCKSAGYTGDTYCTDCQTKLSTGETIPQKEHSYGEYTVVTEATCTAEGKKTRTCAGCGDVQEASIAALGHEYGSDGICVRCGAEEEKQESFFAKILAFFQKIIDFFKKLFG